MSEQADVCYTFEGALEMAISMESDGFRNYLDELAHKYELEKALVEGYITAGELEKPLPTMKLSTVLAKKELKPGSDAREALAYAIHLENGAILFYERMASACAGAPMQKLMERLLADESRHLQQLEDLYEAHFMTEN